MKLFAAAVSFFRANFKLLMFFFGFNTLMTVMTLFTADFSAQPPAIRPSFGADSPVSLSVQPDEFSADTLTGEQQASRVAAGNLRGRQSCYSVFIFCYTGLLILLCFRLLISMKEVLRGTLLSLGAAITDAVRNGLLSVDSGIFLTLFSYLLAALAIFMAGVVLITLYRAALQQGKFSQWKAAIRALPSRAWNAVWGFRYALLLGLALILWLFLTPTGQNLLTEVTR